MGSGGDPQLGRGRVAISGDYISDACRGEAEATCDWSGSSVLSESNSSVLGLSDVDLVWPELTVVWPGRRKPIEVCELEASLQGFGRHFLNSPPNLIPGDPSSSIVGPAEPASFAIA